MQSDSQPDMFNVGRMDCGKIMGAQVESPPGIGPYCLRIHAQINHWTGALHPPAGEPHKFAQLYILDFATAN